MGSDWIDLRCKQQDALIHPRTGPSKHKEILAIGDSHQIPAEKWSVCDYIWQFNLAIENHQRL